MSVHGIWITFYALPPHLTTRSLSSVWCASSCCLCPCLCFSFFLSASPSQCLLHFRCPPITCTSDSSCPFQWLPVPSPAPVSQQPACEESITQQWRFLEVSFSPQLHIMKRLATTALCEAFKVLVNMTWQVLTKGDDRIWKMYLIEELLCKGNHTLVDVNRARLLETMHQVLRTRCFPCSADHELGDISVTQPEDVMETVVHPLL